MRGVYWLLVHAEILILGGCVVILALVAVLTKIGMRALLGTDWSAPRVRVPWRFSLLAVAVLVVLAAGVLAIFRDSPAIAMLVAAFVLALWFPVARFQEFQQVLADRRRRKLAASVDAQRREGGVDK